VSEEITECPMAFRKMALERLKTFQDVSELSAELKSLEPSSTSSGIRWNPSMAA